ncbi:MAG TPA: protein kinase [Gemmatimonadales bacterium]|jgi:serine/threonine-protein kinase|nr:protein kinase [Gemmatimonadales bacterium]
MTDLESELRATLAGRYTIERKLGQGGMATVYLARDLKHGRSVAIKVLRPELAHVLGPARFLQEIEIAARLQHPLILPVFESGAGHSDDSATTRCLWYAMPYIAGESLRDRLDREGQLPIDDAVRIGCEVAQALACAHASGVVHRDIKPENVMLSEGHAIVADFGIARAVGATGTERLTDTGLSLGTPAYMSPEQIGSRGELDGRADQYALGCVMYEMLSGQPPFTGVSAQAILSRHAVDAVPSLRTVRRNVPRGVESAIVRALAKVPADRYPTIGDFATALDRGRLTSPAGRPVKRWALAGPAIALVLVALVLGLRSKLAAKGAANVIRSLAVLPFTNLTGDTAQVYLTEGLTDQLVTSLAQVGALQVISLQHSRSEEASARVLKDNGVQAILGGSLQRAGSAVHVTVRLTTASTGQTLWARGYDGDMESILNLEAEVARSVAEQIQASTTGQERSRLNAPRPAVNPAAYEAYVRGAYFVGRANSEADYRKGIAYFRQAIDADPSYAPAYAGLSTSLASIGYLGMEAPAETRTQAHAAADRALALDSMSGEAHIAAGYVTFYFDWDFATAEREFRRGLELSPRNSTGHFLYGMILTALGRSTEAFAELKLAQDLDPLAVGTISAAARPFYNARRYDEAIAQAHKALEMDSTYGRAHYWVGMADEQLSRPGEAIRELKLSVVQAPIPVYQAALGHAYAVSGDRVRAEEILQGLLERARTTYTSAFDIATIYAGLGDHANTLKWLEKAFQERAPYLTFLAVDPQFDSFRSDPEFRDLLRRIGFSDVT